MKKLKEIPKKNPFRVPDNYFSSLDERIISAASDYEPRERKKESHFRLNRIMAIAASVTILVALGIIAAMLAGRERNYPLAGEINITEAYLYDIDILTIEESVAEKDIFNEKTGADRKDIIDYLILENIDETDIYEKIE